jgi:hypothetical protein
MAFWEQKNVEFCNLKAFYFTQKRNSLVIGRLSFIMLKC